jgi:inosine-uridine nucleoside N-ribohydrolase
MKSITSLIFVLLLSAPAAAKMKVILDTDPGDDIDDAWALAYMLSHDEFELVGVTATHGNTPERAKIPCKMLHVVGRDDVPVAVGRKTNDKIGYQFHWAEDFTAKRPVATPAADFIVEQARKQPGQITLVAVGPLQNVADAIRKEPNLGKLLKRVVLMSGCVHEMAGGKACPAEWNVVASTKDAQLVYSTLPLTIVPLDSTTHVRLEQPERERLLQHETPLTRSLEALYRLWLGRPEQRMTLHDQLAVVETASPGAFFGKKEVLKLVVDDKGMTRIDDKNGKPVTVCLEPKRDEFMKHYLDTLIGQKLGMR